MRYFKLIESPVGVLNLVASENGLTAIVLENDDPRRVRLGTLCESREHRVLIRAESQLRQYFARDRDSFLLALEGARTAA